MRKVIVVSLLLGLMVSIGFAVTLPTGVGAKYGAMAGAGASIVDDITCAYYNPAGITSTGNMELKIGAGAATQGLSDLMASFGNASNPTKFLADSFGKTLDINGGLNAFIGFNVAKIGLSILPTATLTINKPAINTFLGSTIIGVAGYEGILTLGYSLSIPGLPIASLDLGANIKSSNLAIAGSAATGVTTTTDNISTLSGIGYDLGAKASINTGVVPVSVGIVMRDIATSLKGKSKTQTSVYDPISGNITSTVVGEVDAPETTIAPATVIGASTVIPGIGLKVAIDLENIGESKILGASVQSGNLTHIGLEYPILGIVALRAGQVSGKIGGADVQQTTYGAGFNLGVNLNVAAMTDAKDSRNNSTMIDLGFAF